MCAPCKIILDAAAAAAFRGEDPDAAMADACSKVIDQIPDDEQNRMSKNDLWLLRQEDPEKARAEWRSRLFTILNSVAGGALETE